MSDVCAVVLCGGRGERMDGADKPLLPFRDQPMVQYVIEAVARLDVPIVIACNRNNARYAALGTTVLEDATPYNGPFAAICSAARQIDSTWLLVSPGDTPLVDTLLYQRLLNSCKGHGVVAHDGERIQPLFCLLQKRALLEVATDSPISMLRGLRSLQLAEVDCSDLADMFTNINDPAELARTQSS